MMAEVRAGVGKVVRPAGAGKAEEALDLVVVAALGLGVEAEVGMAAGSVAEVSGAAAILVAAVAGRGKVATKGRVRALLGPEAAGMVAMEC